MYIYHYTLDFKISVMLVSDGLVKVELLFLLAWVSFEFLHLQGSPKQHLNYWVELLTS